MRTTHTHSRFEHINSDEIEQLIPTPVVIDAPNTTNTLTKPNEISVSLNRSNPPLQSELSQSKLLHPIQQSKLGADTFAGVAMIIIGTTMYGIYGILSRLSMLGNKSTPYQSAAAMVVAEFGKFIISALLLFNTQGIKTCIHSLKSISINEWLLFSIPAALYSITNNLDFYILQYMDPGSMQVLTQTKIITIALLWWWWFKQSIDKQQWISLILLCIGSIFVAWPENKQLNSLNDNNNNQNEMHSMYVEWPIGPFLVGIQICLSAIAGIYTEWMYQKYGRNKSIHIDNLSMYFWGTLSNGLQFFYMNKDNDPQTHYLFHGFNYWTWLLISVCIIKGLCVAQIIKYFSNIVKLFINGFAILVTGCLTWTIFGLNWTVSYVIGLILVIVAVILYNSVKKLIV